MARRPAAPRSSPLSRPAPLPTSPAAHPPAGGGATHLRNRFSASPSSITFSSLSQSSGFTGNPSTFTVDRDGFGYFSYQTIPALGTVWWFGTYTAVA